MKIENIILDLSKSENISIDILKKYIKSFEKYIKYEIKKYEDISGLEDFKMNKFDYEILYQLYFKTKTSSFKIHILLLYIYSFYKLDGFCFNKKNFPLKIFFNFIKNNENIHLLIINLVTKKLY